MKRFELESYLARGVENLMREVVRVSAKNPAESAFMLKFSSVCLRNSRKRDKFNKLDMHIPPFLICSITSECNLHCAGCYARANHSCHDNDADPSQLSANQWLDVFEQAAELCISFIILAGGEPLMRRDVIWSAARVSKILFPIFTNGTPIEDEYLELFDEHRNLFPVLSIEGDREQTDARRGKGVYDSLVSKMDMMREKGILFGASATVTKENAETVYSEEFVSDLKSNGCKAVFFIEYVPADGRTDIAPDELTRLKMAERLEKLRSSHRDMVFISFPGDEKSSGGCLAAGRGFFHINANGSAEPCPFSPYSDISVRDHDLYDVMNSKLFTALREGGILSDEHSGGCVLFNKREAVEALLDDL